MTLQQTLQSALQKNITALEALYNQPRPDGGVDGANWQFTAMRKSLLEEQQMLLTQIQNCDGPFEVVTVPASDLG